MANPVEKHSVQPESGRARIWTLKPMFIYLKIGFLLMLLTTLTNTKEILQNSSPYHGEANGQSSSQPILEAVWRLKKLAILILQTAFSFHDKNHSKHASDTNILWNNDKDFLLWEMSQIIFRTCFLLNWLWELAPSFTIFVFLGKFFNLFEPASPSVKQW